MATEKSETRKIPRSRCPHTDKLDPSLDSEATACQVCGVEEHLRICLTCGAVRCCESHQAHNREHWREEEHPFIRPHREDYEFLWCFACEAYLI